LFSAFLAAHFILTIRNFRRQTVYAVLYLVTLVLIPSYYKKMLTLTAVREYQKKISEEYNSINLNIRTICVAFKRNILKAERM